MNSDELAEYQAMRDASAWTADARDQFLMRGGDAAAVLHKMCSNDITGLQRGQGREAFVCSVQGKTLGHIWAYRAEDGLRIDTAAEQAAVLIAHLDRYVIREDVAFHDLSHSLASGWLIGPHAGEILQRAMDAAPPAAPLEEQVAEWAGDELWVRRLPWGEQVFQLVAPRTAISQIAEALAAQGAVLSGSAALDAFRIEQKVPIYGRDILPDNLPQEIDRNPSAISFTKGCYLGQETVARIDAMGHVNRQLCGLRLSTPAPPTPGAELSAGGKIVGKITSACYSPQFQAALALGFVRREHAAVGAELMCGIDNAVVVDLPAPIA